MKAMPRTNLYSEKVFVARAKRRKDWKYRESIIRVVYKESFSSQSALEELSSGCYALILPVSFSLHQYFSEFNLSLSLLG